MGQGQIRIASGTPVPAAGFAALAAPAPGRPLRLALFGDGLIDAAPRTSKSDKAVTRSFPADCFATWMRIVSPQVALNERPVDARPGQSVPIAASRFADALPAWTDIDAVLISAGTADCFAMIRGVAPPMEESAAGYARMARAALATGIRPIFLVPPPCPQFENGLFADRYIAIGATLRRLARENPDIGLVDATSALVPRGAFGIVPEPGFTTGDEQGRLTQAGARRLGHAIAAELRRLFPLAAPRARPEGATVLHPADLTVELNHAAGITVDTLPLAIEDDGRGLRLDIRGGPAAVRRSIRLVHALPADALATLKGGDSIEVTCSFSLSGNAGGIAAIVLQMVPVWSNGFIGLRSSDDQDAATGLPTHGGVLRTPRFAVLSPLNRVGLSVTLHVPAGADLKVPASLSLGRLLVQRTSSPSNGPRANAAATQ